MKKSQPEHGKRYERLIFTLPSSVAADLRRYADVLRAGNKSGLAADAIRWYLDHLRKVRHTEKLRESYAKAAEHGRRISRQWEGIDDETWARLDQLEVRGTRAS
jgi:hypothetical protein